MSRRSERAFSSSVTRCVSLGTKVRWRRPSFHFFPSSASATACRLLGCVRTSNPSAPWFSTSSAPASMAASITASSVGPAFTSRTPKRSKFQATAPAKARLPPPFAKQVRTSPAVRFRLSVRHSTMRATPPGPYPS